MKSRQGGNGSSKFEIGTHDMGGWVRVVAAFGGPPPADLALYLSHAVTAWFRSNSHLKLRCVLPVNKDGTTVELHAWYDQIHFKDASPLAPSGAGEA